MTSYLALRLFGSLAELSGHGAPTDDDTVDRMNHVMSAALLVVLAAIVTTSQFVGDPIICVDDTHDYKGSHLDYVNALCWIKNTHDVPFQSHPADYQSEVLYYQWVPLILLVIAACFKAPNLVWQMLNGATGLNIEKVASLAESTQLLDPEARDDKMEEIAHCLDRWLVHARAYQTRTFRSLRREVGRAGLLLCCLGRRSGTYLCGAYVFCKLLYLANSIAQFFLLQVFLGFDIYEAVKILLEKDQMDFYPNSTSPSYRLERFFPRQTQCHFEIRQMANTQPYTFQCLLPVNMLSEKIFIVVWFWLCLMAATNAYSFLIWFYRIVLRRDRVNTVAKYLTGMVVKPEDRQDYYDFLNHYLRDDGVFVLRLISDNSHNIVLLELLPLLWKTYRERVQAALEKKKKKKEKEKEREEREKKKKEEEEGNGGDENENQDGCETSRNPDSGETALEEFDLGEGIPMREMNSSFRYKKVPL